MLKIISIPGVASYTSFGNHAAGAKFGSSNLWQNETKCVGLLISVRPVATFHFQLFTVSSRYKIFKSLSRSTSCADKLLFFKSNLRELIQWRSQAALWQPCSRLLLLMFPFRLSTTIPSTLATFFDWTGSNKRWWPDKIMPLPNECPMTARWHMWRPNLV